jgi:NADH:ubiquinone oxidoreductase subunit H
MRIDQVMNFCWKFLIPISLGLFILIVIVDKLAQLGIPDYISSETFSAMLPRTLILLAVNAVVAGAAGLWIARKGRQERAQREARGAVVESGLAQQAGK